MSEMKCPFCGQELKKRHAATTDYNSMFITYYCGNPECESTTDLIGCKEFWDILGQLIRTRKALEQSEICCTEWEKQALDYKAENIALSGDLERTRKALEIAVDALKRLEKELYFNNAKQTGHIADSVMSIPSIALEQITAMEQKNHFANVSKKVEQKDK